MDNDYRNRTSSPYDAQTPMYRQSSTPSSHPMYGPSLYPRVGQQSQTVGPPVGRASTFHHSSSSSPSPSSSSGLGIRVTLKPEYRITPPPQLSPQFGEIPRSNFQFDFEFERKLLSEAEKDSQYWSRLGLENFPSRPTPSPSSSSLSSGPAGDPVVTKYISLGLSREAVPLAVAQYGDNPTKVREFANSYTLLREMGFSSSSISEALIMYDNDTDKALAHFLNSSS